MKRIYKLNSSTGLISEYIYRVWSAGDNYYMLNRIYDGHWINQMYNIPMDKHNGGIEISEEDLFIEQI